MFQSRIFPTVLALLGFMTMQVWAVDEWTGSSRGASWGSNSSWSEGAPPTGSETALFDQSSSPTPISLGPVSDPHILFDGAAGPYNLSSGTFTVTSSATNDFVELGSTATSFTNSNVTENVNTNFIISSGQNLTVQNNSSDMTDALSLGGQNISGAGQLTLDGANTASTLTIVFGPTINYLNLASSQISVPTVVKNGTGAWELSGQNSFTTLEVNNGILAFTQGQALSGTVYLGVSGGTSGTLESVGQGTISVSRDITVRGSGTVGFTSGSNLALNGTETITDSTLTFSGAGNRFPETTNATVYGKITGGTTSTFDSNVNVVNGSVLFANAGNDYAGTTNIYNGGTLVTQYGGLLPAGTVVNMGSVGQDVSTEDYLGISADQTIAGLNSYGNSLPFVYNVAKSGPAITLTISGINSDGQTVNSTFGGSLGDGPNGTTAGGFATTALKITGGVLTLTGFSNIYSGGTTITGGTLLANGTSPSETGSGKVLVSSGGTLGGSGVIAPTTSTSNVEVADGGKLRPGTAAVGNVAQNFLKFSLSSANSNFLEFDAPTGGAAQLEFTLGAGTAPTDASGFSFVGSSSFIKLLTDGQGEVQFNGNLVQIDDLTGGALNGQYLLFSAGANSDYAGLITDATGRITSGLSLTGTDAANYADAALFLENGDIVLAVPEPSCWMLLVGGIGFLVLARRLPSPRVR